MSYLLNGLVIGVSVAAPVGPIGVLCIQKTVLHGRRAGLLSGLGAATADAVYGSIAGFGIALVSNFLVEQRTWIHFIGGLLLVLFGVRGFLTKPSQHAPQTLDKVPNLWWDYVSTFLMTLANPMTILSFIAIFAALGVANSSNQYASATFTVVGVFLGSAFWWLALSGLAGWLRGKLNGIVLSWIGKLSSLIILGFGFFAIISSNAFG
jgi:threonine/homoserine/homoserine lactone efflux protein